MEKSKFYLNHYLYCIFLFTSNLYWSNFIVKHYLRFFFSCCIEFIHKLEQPRVIKGNEARFKTKARPSDDKFCWETLRSGAIWRLDHGLNDLSIIAESKNYHRVIGALLNRETRLQTKRKDSPFVEVARFRDNEEISL